MGHGYGREVIDSVGGSIELCADGQPEMKAGGVTFDWATVTAHSGADLTLPDGIVIKDGEKYLRYGQPITKITQVESQVIDLSAGADPTAGTWDITDILGEAIEGIVWNVTAAALQALVNALPVEFADEITVAKSGFQYTFTFPERLENVATMTVDFTDLTSATSVTVTPTNGSASAGNYGIADTGASDGRQTLTRGSVFLVNTTVRELDLHSDHPPALEGGLVWKDRIIAGGSGQPTFANLIAAMPRLRFVTN